MNTPAPTATAWWVEVNVGEVDGVSTANAVLHTRDRTRLEARGTARLNPHDPDVPEIGYELATAGHSPSRPPAAGGRRRRHLGSDPGDRVRVALEHGPAED